MFCYAFWLFLVQLLFELFGVFEGVQPQDQSASNQQSIQHHCDYHSKYIQVYSWTGTFGLGSATSSIGRMQKAILIYLKSILPAYSI